MLWLGVKNILDPALIICIRIIVPYDLLVKLGEDGNNFIELTIVGGEIKLKNMYRVFKTLFIWFLRIILLVCSFRTYFVRVCFVTTTISKHVHWKRHRLSYLTCLNTVRRIIIVDINHLYNSSAHRLCSSNISRQSSPGHSLLRDVRNYIGLRAATADWVIQINTRVRLYNRLCAYIEWPRSIIVLFYDSYENPSRRKCLLRSCVCLGEGTAFVAR